MTGTDATLRRALAFAEAGWPVFPCQPGQKVPATRHGFQDATTDPGQITRWFTRHPGWNLAVATGAPGPDVLDVDQHGQAGNGFAAFNRLTRAGLPTAPAPTSPRPAAGCTPTSPAPASATATCPPTTSTSAPPAATSSPHPRRWTASPTSSSRPPKAATGSTGPRPPGCYSHRSESSVRSPATIRTAMSAG